MRHFGGGGRSCSDIFGAFPAGETISLLLLIIVIAFCVIPLLKPPNVGLFPPISGAEKGLSQNTPDLGKIYLNDNFYSTNSLICMWFKSQFKF